jgi:hypothetical protein
MYGVKLVLPFTARTLGLWIRTRIVQGYTSTPASFLQVDALRLVAFGQNVYNKVKKIEKSGAGWNRCVGDMDKGLFKG